MAVDPLYTGTTAFASLVAPVLYSVVLKMRTNAVFVWSVVPAVATSEIFVRLVVPQFEFGALYGVAVIMNILISAAIVGLVMGLIVKIR